MSVIMLGTLTRRIPMSARSMQLAVQPTLMRARPIHYLRALRVPNGVIPTCRLCFHDNHDAPSYTSLPRVNLVTVTSVLLFDVAPRPTPAHGSAEHNDLGTIILAQYRRQTLTGILMLNCVLLQTGGRTVTHTSRTR